MTADFLIRTAAPGDLSAITGIYAHAVTTSTASFELDPPDESEMRRRYEALLAGGHPYLVAERRGGIAGYAYAGPYRPRLAYRSTVEDSIYLAPDAQGRGLGRQLLGALIAAAEVAGFRQMVGVIGDSGHKSSIRLHERLGFRMVGILENVGWKHGRWLDSVLMQRALGPGSAEPPIL
ncbi:GNAT family N-acetyltransferase [Kaistia dalseonensis]|uniref:Phosphinothricin acetyltransferase n=1 Tax=Kaistia dalseonensis TaxID=410840 RepID=A0ABU0H554_9HYPH|nr:GNAT family N-acetyltransferase [Kaistia dalseonensis]MCX5494304.1 GNAT family N-acetyltransferase [Kaistia dalseonensis]MDQ0436885.1 phosphinothricin acetyltransferase [Kaistia dalseonensis]